MTERERAVRELADEIMELAAPDGHLIKWPVGAIEGRLREFLAELKPTAQVQAERDAATKTLAKMLEREMPPGTAADLIGLHKELEAVKAERDALRRAPPVPDDPGSHDAHVIGKFRRHGDRDGELVFYLCGPQRETVGEADADLTRYLGSDDRGWAIALQSLTPGGSEFQSPEACVDYLRDRQSRRDDQLRDGIRERRSLAGQVASLRGALEEHGQHSRSCKFDTPEIKCPQCAGPLLSVPKSPCLNTDQWDAVKAGDYYCESCSGNRGNTGHRYFNREELPKQPCSCGLAAALASGAGRAEAEVLQAAITLVQSEAWAEFWAVRSSKDAPDEWTRLEMTVDALLGGGPGEGGRGAGGLRVPLVRAAIAWADKKIRFKAAAAALEARQNAQSQSDWVEALHQIKAGEDRLLGEVEKLLGVRREDVDDPEHIARAVARDGKGEPRG